MAQVEPSRRTPTGRRRAEGASAVRRRVGELAGSGPSAATAGMVRTRMLCSAAMPRLAALLVLVLSLLQGSGLDARVSELACADRHHESEGTAAEECPPECATCACCVRVTFPLLMQTVFVVDAIPTPTSYFDRGAQHLPAPPPRGILHVPRVIA